jgi:hypothetical protein
MKRKRITLTKKLAEVVDSVARKSELSKKPESNKNIE